MAQATIRIRIDGETGRGWLVDEKDQAIDTTQSPYAVLTPEQQRQVYEGTGFKLVGSLYYSHNSPGCLYWINGIPVILPCP